MSELKELLSPSALPVLLVLGALIVLLIRMERGRAEMIRTIASEVRRMNAEAEHLLPIKQPFVVSPEDPPVARSACVLHMKSLQARIDELSRRVDRSDNQFHDDVKRLHERIDEIPARVIALLGDTKSIHSRDT